MNMTHYLVHFFSFKSSTDKDNQVKQKFLTKMSMLISFVSITVFMSVGLKLRLHSPLVSKCFAWAKIKDLSFLFIKNYHKDIHPLKK